MRLGRPARFDRHAARRHLVDHGDVQIAVERERKRARNRRGRHHQHVRRRALFHQFLALQDAEAVLLVHDHQAQAREFHLRLEQRVRPHDELRRAGSHALERRLFLRRFHSADQQLDAVAGARKYFSRGQIMLHGENFRRRHQRGLVAVFDHDRRRFQRHDRLAAANVALQQAVHRHGAFQVRGDFRRARASARRWA